MILNEIEGGEGADRFRLRLHPSVTVVTGLSAEQRRNLAASVSAAMHGYQPGVRLNVSVFGQEGWLSPQVIAALGFAGLDADNVMDVTDLPAVRVLEEGGETLRDLLDRLRRGDTCQAPAEVVRAVAPVVKAEPVEQPVEPEEPEIDPYSLPAVLERMAAVRAAQAELADAEQALNEAQAAHDASAVALEAVRAAEPVDEAAEVEPGDPDLPPPPVKLDLQLPEFQWDDPYASLIEEEEASAAIRRIRLSEAETRLETEKADAEAAAEQALASAASELERAEQRLVSATAALEAAVEQSAAATATAQALESEVEVKTEAVEALRPPAEVEIPSTTAVTAALSAAREEAPPADDKPTFGQLADRWDALSARIEELKAAPKPPAWLIAQVRDEFEDAEARVKALRFQKESGIDVREHLARAEKRLADATAEWEEMKASPALEYERVDAEAARMYAEFTAMLGFQPGRKFLGEALRAEQQKADEVSSPEKRLRDALAVVGVEATAGEAVSVAEGWLERIAADTRARDEARAALEQARQELAEVVRRHEEAKALATTAAEAVSEAENDLSAAVTERDQALERHQELVADPDQAKKQAVVRIKLLEDEISGLTESLDASERAVQELRAEQTIDRERAKREHDKRSAMLAEQHEAAFAKELEAYEKANAAALVAAEERRAEMLAAAEQRMAERRRAHEAEIAEAEEAADHDRSLLESRQTEAGRLREAVGVAEAEVEETAQSEMARIEAERAAEADRLQAERDAALAEEAAKLAEIEAERTAQEALRVAADDGPWWRRGGGPQVSGSVDATKIKRDDLDFYILAKGASLRSIGRAESMPLIIDGAFDELPALAGQAAFDRLGDIAEIVQVVYLAGNDKAERWMERQRESLGRQTRMTIG